MPLFIPPRIAHPGYLPGRWYTTALCTRSTAAISAINVLSLYPFFLPFPAAITALTTRFTVAGAGSSVKAGIWANNPVNMRPLGAPLIKDDTGISTAGSPAEITFASNAATLPAGFYWAGSKFTGTLPTMVIVGTAEGYTSWAFGFEAQAALTTNVIAMADTYSNNLPTIAEAQAWTNTSANACLLGFKT